MGITMATKKMVTDVKLAKLTKKRALDGEKYRTQSSDRGGE